MLRIHHCQQRNQRIIRKENVLDRVPGLIQQFAERKIRVLHILEQAQIFLAWQGGQKRVRGRFDGFKGV